MNTQTRDVGNSAALLCYFAFGGAMKVTAFANVDVDCEVEVDLNDVLREFAEQIEECNEHKLPIRLAGTMDQLTRVLAIVSDEMIAAMKPEHTAIIRDRLVTESARWPVRALGAGSK